MFQHVLKRIRDKVHAHQYVMTLHAEEEMNDDELTIFDIERSLLTGEIIERQRQTETGEWKYLIKGQTIAGDQIILDNQEFASSCTSNVSHTP